jgi:hypothetical protein
VVERRPGLTPRWVTSSRRPLRAESYRRGGSPPPARSERGEGPRKRGQVSWTASVGRHLVSNVTPPRDDRWDRDRRGLQGVPHRGVRQRRAGPKDHRPPRARKRPKGAARSRGSRCSAEHSRASGTRERVRSCSDQCDEERDGVERGGGDVSLVRERRPRQGAPQARDTTRSWLSASLKVTVVWSGLPRKGGAFVEAAGGVRRGRGIERVELRSRRVRRRDAFGFGSPVEVEPSGVFASERVSPSEGDRPGESALGCLGSGASS